MQSLVITKKSKAHLVFSIGKFRPSCQHLHLTIHIFHIEALHHLYTMGAMYSSIFRGEELFESSIPTKSDTEVYKVCCSWTVQYKFNAR